MGFWLDARGSTDPLGRSGVQEVATTQRWLALGYWCADHTLLNQSARRRCAATMRRLTTVVGFSMLADHNGYEVLGAGYRGSVRARPLAGSQVGGSCAKVPPLWRGCCEESTPYASYAALAPWCHGRQWPPRFRVYSTMALRWAMVERGT